MMHSNELIPVPASLPSDAPIGSGTVNVRICRRECESNNVESAAHDLPDRYPT
jgi:hypothetical protein